MENGNEWLLVMSDATSFGGASIFILETREARFFSLASFTIQIAY